MDNEKEIGADEIHHEACGRWILIGASGKTFRGWNCTPLCKHSSYHESFRKDYKVAFDTGKTLRDAEGLV